jgi:hypothetical protein
MRARAQRWTDCRRPLCVRHRSARSADPVRRQRHRRRCHPRRDSAVRWRGARTGHQRGRRTTQNVRLLPVHRVQQDDHGLLADCRSLQRAGHSLHARGRQLPDVSGRSDAVRARLAGRRLSGVRNIACGWILHDRCGAAFRDMSHHRNELATSEQCGRLARQRIRQRAAAVYHAQRRSRLSGRRIWAHASLVRAKSCTRTAS